MALAFGFGGNALAKVIDNQYAAHFGILDFDGGGATGRVGVYADVGVELLQRAGESRLVNAGRTSIVKTEVNSHLKIMPISSSTRRESRKYKQHFFANER